MTCWWIDDWNDNFDLLPRQNSWTDYLTSSVSVNIRRLLEWKEIIIWWNNFLLVQIKGEYWFSDCLTNEFIPFKNILVLESNTLGYQTVMKVDIKQEYWRQGIYYIVIKDKQNK